MPVYLTALGLRNYRGIGREIQKMPNFKTFNFFIGANNAGKSTVLNFISRHLPPNAQTLMPAGESNKLDPLEKHDRAGGLPVHMEIGFSEDQVIDALNKAHPTVMKHQGHQPNVIKIVRAIADECGMVWKGSDLPYTRALSLAAVDGKRIRPLIQVYDWQNLWNALTKQGNGDIERHWIPDTIGAIDNALGFYLPQVRLIPAIREIGPKGAAFEDFSGVGLIDQLASIQNPEHDRRHQREKFDRINGFLRYVTGKPDAEIEVPYSREHILVHMDGRVLPLASLGTGIQEVIMIAAFCTIAENEIICIEEPELHLHPLLQRKLVRYLSAETENQYFIATHSAAFIDTRGAAIFHVTLENGTTHIREAVLRQDRFAICVDLGHRASDIVQANAVLWVEGPSDRIYLQHWISLIDPDLVEGIHYSIMFYGGRLLSHLSADDEEVTEFIQLRSLNRNLAIMMDSDKSNPHARVNATKLRLLDEFEKHGGIAWITKGREVENYIKHARLQSAVAKVAGEKYAAPLPASPYEHALHYQRKVAKKSRKGNPALDLIERDVDKVKVSRAVVEDGANELDVLDLKEQVTEIVQMIRNANN